MLNTLQFNMSLPTPYVFLTRFLKAAEANIKVCLKVNKEHLCYLYI